MAEKKKKTSQKRSKKFLTVRGNKVEVFDSVPEGWKADEHATTAPRGYKWVSNGKSRFGGQRKSALIKVAPTAADNPKKADKPTVKATPAKPVKAAQKPAGKRTEPAPAAPKKAPMSAKKDTEKEAKAKLAGEVYDLMMLGHTPEQRKRLPSRESFIQDQLKPVIVGGRNFGTITMKELEDAKKELLQKYPPQAKKTTPAKPVKAAQKPAGKHTEPAPAAPKKEPLNTKKLARTQKKATKTDKLLVHSDKDEMKVTGEKPIIINGKSVKPKRAPKVLRKVKTGGYTAWDDIKRNGKTFATEKEAKDYALDVLKKTGIIVPISPTDRKVTHTFKSEDKAKK